MAEVAVPKELFEEILQLTRAMAATRSRVGTGPTGCVITMGGVCLNDEKNDQIGGSNVVWDDGKRREHCTPCKLLAGAPAVCYHLRGSGVHFGNVG
jgi:hypothetical protein